MQQPKFKIKRSSNRKYYFTLEAANAETLGTSEMYESKQAAHTGIEAVRTAAKIKSFAAHYSKNNQFYFTLVAANSECVLLSEMYRSAHARFIGMKAVATAAAIAEVIEIYKKSA